MSERSIPPRRRQKPATPHTRAKSSRQATVRIVGGRFRGRRLFYTGDPRTRPMKDRVREATFDLLGPDVVRTHAIDLFGGTGILAFEALSRGAIRATIIERHIPTAKVIERNRDSLAVQPATTVVIADAFFWVRTMPCMDATPWTVFCSPPYRFYEQRNPEMLEMIKTLLCRAPGRSNIVVESDLQFDVAELPNADRWSVRSYPPARLALYRNEEQ